MIGTASYRYATEIIGESQELGDLALGGLLCQRDKLFESNINPRERFRRELFASLSATYGLIAQKHIRANPSMLQFVKILNDHVLNYYGEEYGYANLDEFLIDQYLQMPPTYAALSEFIGYTVTEIGDKAAEYSDIDENWEDIDLFWNKIGWENF